ncbi:hypothetical protein SMICM304S_11999 [Streptomyces microflavus]
MLGRMDEVVACAAPRGIGAIVVGSFPLSSGQWFDAHSHPQHQLAWTRRGVLGVAVGDAYWILPPTRALWLPAGVVHRTGATRDAVLCSLYLEPDRCGLDWAEPTPVGIDGLLAHLIAHLAREDLADDARLRAEAVVLDLLRPLPTTPIDVPYPVDDRLRAVADTLLADPADSRRLGHAHTSAGRRRIGRRARSARRVWASAGCIWWLSPPAHCSRGYPGGRLDIGGLSCRSRERLAQPGRGLSSGEGAPRRQ